MIGVKRQLRKKRRNRSSVLEVELQEHHHTHVNVNGGELQERDIYEDTVELQRQQSNGDAEDGESPFLPTDRGQSNNSNGSYLKPKKSSDDGYEDLSLFSEETELDVGTPFLGRHPASLAKRPFQSYLLGRETDCKRDH